MPRTSTIIRKARHARAKCATHVCVSGNKQPYNWTYRPLSSREWPQQKNGYRKRTFTQWTITQQLKTMAS